MFAETDHSWALHYNRMVTASHSPTDQFRKVGFASFNMVSLHKSGSSLPISDLKDKQVVVENNYVPVPLRKC